MKKLFGKITEIWNKYQYILTGQQKRLGVVLFIMLILGSFLEMIGVSVVIPFVQALLSPEELLGHKLIGTTLTGLGITDSQSIIVTLTLGMIGVYLFKNLFLTVLAWVKSKYWRKIERETALRLFDSYIHREYAFHLDTNSAVLLRSTDIDTNSISVMLENLFNIAFNGISALMIGVFIVAIDPQMAMGLILACGLILFVVMGGFKKMLKVQGERNLFLRGQVLNYLQQAFDGIKEILLSGRQDYFGKKVKSTMERRSRAVALQHFAGECPQYIIETVVISVFVGILAIRACVSGMSPAFVSNIAAFAVAAFRILPCVGRISSNYNSAIFYESALENVYQNLKDAEDHQAPEEAKNDSHSKTGDFQSAICLQHVDWQYPSGDRKILDDANLQISKGEAVGLIGPSGGGKSTTLDIIMGLYVPQRGRVEVDGKPISEMGKDWLHLFGYVPQNVYISDSTIRNNVAFGIMDEEIDDSQVWRSLEQAQMADYIRSLPDGLDTVVGENGMRISGGQRQRIAIARALYTDPPILFLDEATSALDSETEAAVMEAIDHLRGQKTMLIVAHRISTLAECDHIYQVKDGEILRIEKGDLFE